jgi:hypothetical protein
VGGIRMQALRNKTAMIGPVRQPQLGRRGDKSSCFEEGWHFPRCRGRRKPSHLVGEVAGIVDLRSAKERHFAA